MTTPTTNDPQQQQLPPSASDEPVEDLYREVMPDPAPSTGATAGETILREWLESAHGDEDVDDDGSTIRDWFEYADISRLDLERRITAEVAQLRADLAHAQAEREKLHEAWVLECNLADSRGRDRDYLRAQVDAMRPVVEAARFIIQHPKENYRLTLRTKLAALDQAQQQQQQEVPD